MSAVALAKVEALLVEVVEGSGTRMKCQAVLGSSLGGLRMLPQGKRFPVGGETHVVQD